MPLIWRLKLPVRQRMAVISIFGVGIVVNVAGAIRTAFVYKSLIASYDSTWVGWPIFLAAAIEINLGLVRYFETPLPHCVSANCRQDLRFRTCSPSTGGTLRSAVVSVDAQPRLVKFGPKRSYAKTLEVYWALERLPIQVIICTATRE